MTRAQDSAQSVLFLSAWMHSGMPRWDGILWFDMCIGDLSASFQTFKRKISVHGIGNPQYYWRGPQEGTSKSGNRKDFLNWSPILHFISLFVELTPHTTKCTKKFVDECNHMLMEVTTWVASSFAFRFYCKCKFGSTTIYSTCVPTQQCLNQVTNLLPCFLMVIESRFLFKDGEQDVSNLGPSIV